MEQNENTETVEEVKTTEKSTETKVENTVENAGEEKDTSPVVEFDDSEDEKKLAYEKSIQEKKIFFANCLISNITKIVFAIICFIFTPKTGVLGTFLFAIAIFYFLPIGVIRTFVYAYRLTHVKDYIAYDNDFVAVDLFHFMHRHLKRKGE